MVSHRIRCPHCDNVLEFIIEDSKNSEPVTTYNLVNRLQAENAQLKYDNQRLNIINHQHRGE